MKIKHKSIICAVIALLLVGTLSIAIFMLRSRSLTASAAESETSYVSPISFTSEMDETGQVDSVHFSSSGHSWSFGTPTLSGNSFLSICSSGSTHPETYSVISLFSGDELVSYVSCSNSYTTNSSSSYTAYPLFPRGGDVSSYVSYTNLSAYYYVYDVFDSSGKPAKLAFGLFAVRKPSTNRSVSFTSASDWFLTVPDFMRLFDVSLYSSSSGGGGDVDEAYQNGYDTGYQLGYDEGLLSSESYQNGYDLGYSNGMNKALSDSITNPVSFFIEPVQKFLDTKLFGIFSLGSALNVVLFVSFALIFIKMFAG